MKHFLKIPALTCSLLFAVAQPALAQTSSTQSGTGSNTGTHTGTNTGTHTGTNTGNPTGTNRDTGGTTSSGTSVGNSSDMSGGTTNTGSENANPKTAKSSRDCAANEEFVKQGDRMVCVRRATSDRGQKDQNQQSPQ